MIESYNTLPLGKYIEIVDIFAHQEDPLQRQVATLSILTGMDEDEILNLPIVEYKALSAKSKFLESAPPSDARRVGTIKVAGVEYVPTLDIRKMTTTQYVDFQAFAQDAVHNLPQLLSVFLIPKGKKYNDGYDVAEVQKIFRESVPVADANAVCAFFFKRFNDSMRGMLIYSRWQVKKMKEGPKKEELLRKIQETETHLSAGGDGLRMSMQLRKPSDVPGTMSGK